MPVQTKTRVWLVALLAAATSAGLIWSADHPAAPTSPTASQGLTASAAPAGVAQAAVSGRVDSEDVGTFTVWWTSASGTAKRSVETAPDGSFTLPIDGPGTVWTAPATLPSEVHIDGPVSDLVFHREPLCPLTVTLIAPDGQPASDIALSASVAPAPATSFLAPEHHPMGSAVSDKDGRLSFSEIICGVASLQLDSDDYVPLDDVRIDTLVDTAAQIQLREGVRVYGTVTDADGTPIAGAELMARSGGIRGQGRSGPQGEYTLRVATGDRIDLHARHDTHLAHSAQLSVEGEGAIEHSIVLNEGRLVSLECLGLPDEHCGELYPLQCLAPGGDEGEECDTEQDPVRCLCPLGDAEIITDSMRTDVPADAATAALDFRGRSSLTLRVVDAAGEPGECQVMVSGAPGAECDSDGFATVYGVQRGSQDVMIATPEQMKPLGEVEIRAGENDLGTITMSAGGVLEGVLLSSATGQGVAGVQISILSEEAFVETTTTTEGRFVAEGLPDGEYHVLPGEGEPGLATIIDGHGTIQLQVVEKPPAPERGFDLEVIDSAFIISDVQPGSSAEESGLRVGDRIVDVGAESTDGTAHRCTDTWSLQTCIGSFGPGKGRYLMIEREGEALDIAL